MNVHQMTYRKIALGLLALVFAVLAYAWFDGGEEPLRPLVQPIALPDSVPESGE